MATRKRRVRKRKRTSLKSDLSRPSSSILPKVHRLNSGGGDNSFSHNVNAHLGRKLAAPASNTFDPETDPYHAHLHSSLRAFRFRKWRPLTPEQMPQPTVTRCRPLTCRPRSSQALRGADISNDTGIPAPPLPLSSHRPCSASQLLMLKRPDTPRVDHGPFDMLSPRVLAHLVTDPRPLTPLSTYGDVIEEKKSKKKGKKPKQAVKEEGEEKAESKTRDAQTDAEGTRFFENDGEVSFTSGIESDGLESDDDEDSDDSDDDSDNDSISELEKGKEPPVDKNRRVPDLHLRPERLDQLYIPENRRDHARRFDFDASNCEIPAYEFECPVDAPYNKINFRFHAREGTDWRQTNYAIGANVPSTLTIMFDRLLEMEKRQIETEEWEERKMKQVAAAAAVAAARRRAASRRLASGKPIWRGAGVSNGSNGSSGGSGGWDNSSNGSGGSSRRCCHSCLQQACVGDCPEKRVPAATRMAAACPKCHQPLCTGTCTDMRYDQRMRRPRGEEDNSGQPLHPRFAGHRNCKTCLHKHNAKYINANNVVLGRPKSAFSTYSRGKCSAKPRDLRPKSALELTEGLSKGMERLGIDPLQPTPPSIEKLPRPHSRSGIIPGKSYTSNLSRSLTDLSSKRKRSAKAKKKASAL